MTGGQPKKFSIRSVRALSCVLSCVVLRLFAGSIRSIAVPKVIRAPVVYLLQQIIGSKSYTENDPSLMFCTPNFPPTVTFAVYAL